MRYRKLKKGEYAGNFGYFVAGEKVIHRQGFLPPGSMADFGATRCGNPFPRRKAWQAGPTSGKSAAPFVFAQSTTLRYALAARRTDCPVASLLAMTVGEVLAPVDTPCLLHTLRAPRPCTRAHVPAFCMSLRTSAHTCGNPRPRRNAWQVGTTSGKSAAPFVFARSTTFRYALPQGERIVPSLRSSQ